MKPALKKVFSGTIVAMLALQGCGSAPSTEKVGSEPELVGSAPMNGEPGKDGRDGIDGANGERGPAGPSGTQGLTGPMGIQGFIGPVGPNGEGLPGPAGPKGDNGDKGEKGDKGDPADITTINIESLLPPMPATNSDIVGWTRFYQTRGLFGIDYEDPHAPLGDMVWVQMTSAGQVYQGDSNYSISILYDDDSNFAGFYTFGPGNLPWATTVMDTDTATTLTYPRSSGPNQYKLVFDSDVYTGYYVLTNQGIQTYASISTPLAAYDVGKTGGELGWYIGDYFAVIFTKS